MKSRELIPLLHKADTAHYYEIDGLLSKANQPGIDPKLSKILENKIGLILLEAWKNFPRYFNNMNDEDRKKLNDALKTELTNRMIFVKRGDSFYVDRDKIMFLKKERPFSFAYQALRLRLYQAVPQETIETLNNFFQLIENQTKTINNEKEKLSKMNFLIIKNYLALHKSYPQSRLTHALKSYIQNPPYSPLDTFAFKIAYELMKYLDKRRGALLSDEARINKVEELVNKILTASSYKKIKQMLTPVVIPSNSTLYFAYKKMSEKANKYADYEENAPKPRPNIINSHPEQHFSSTKIDSIININKDIQAKNYMNKFKDTSHYKNFEEAKLNYTKLNYIRGYQNPKILFETTMNLHKAAAELQRHFEDTYASSSQFSNDDQPFRTAYRQLSTHNYFQGLNNLIDDCEKNLHSLGSSNQAKRFFTIMMIALDKITTNRDKTVLINKMREVMSSNKPDNTKYAELREELDKTIHQIDKTYFGKPVFFAGYKVFGSRLRVELEKVRENENNFIVVDKKSLSIR